LGIGDWGLGSFSPPKLTYLLAQAEPEAISSVAAKNPPLLAASCG